MTLFEFQLLSETEKLELIYREGIYIGKCKTAGVTTVLYQIDSFYIELFYSQYRRYVKRTRCFTSTAFLDPYLRDIDIGMLVNGTAST